MQIGRKPRNESATNKVRNLSDRLAFLNPIPVTTNRHTSRRHLSMKIYHLRPAADDGLGQGFQQAYLSMSFGCKHPH